MDYWDKPLTHVITPKNGPLPQMTSLLDANRAIIGNLPQGYLKRAHWLTAGQALVTAAETGKSSDIELAFDSIVAALEEEGWRSPRIYHDRLPFAGNPPEHSASGGNEDLAAPRTDEPLWRRIRPNGHSPP
jgi:hypothetical protein